MSTADLWQQLAGSTPQQEATPRPATAPPGGPKRKREGAEEGPEGALEGGPEEPGEEEDLEADEEAAEEEQEAEEEVKELVGGVDKEVAAVAAVDDPQAAMQVRAGGA